MGEADDPRMMVRLVETIRDLSAHEHGNCQPCDDIEVLGDALAAAVEQLNEYDLEVGVFIQRAQDAARAWRAARGAP